MGRAPVPPLGRRVSSEKGRGVPTGLTNPVDDGTMMSWQSTIRPPTSHSTRACGRSWLASLAADGGGQKGV